MKKCVNIPSCSFISWLNCAKAQKPNVNNGIDTGKDKTVNAEGKYSTYKLPLLVVSGGIPGSIMTPDNILVGTMFAH